MCLQSAAAEQARRLLPVRVRPRLVRLRAVLVVAITQVHGAGKSPVPAGTPPTPHPRISLTHTPHHIAHLN
jgi:hypothetical protein